MEQKLDKQRVQEFARKIFGLYTSGLLTLMVDIGHKTGLFEAVAKGPATSHEIAARARLDERYVREWLGAMATGGIVTYDAASRAFALPPEHAVCLTGTSSRNLAAGSQSLPMLAKRLPGVVECFRHGGGVPYTEFRPDFTEAQDASWRLLYDGLLIKGFLPAVKGLPERLARGIREFDCVEPLVWNQRTGYLVGGHQRLKILRERGDREVSVSVVDLSPERERALNILLNNPSAQGDWDYDKLAELIKELQADEKFDATLTGFDEEELRTILFEPELEPLEAESPELLEVPAVEVILSIPPATYEAVRPELDALVGRYGLECHVRKVEG